MSSFYKLMSKQLIPRECSNFSYCKPFSLISFINLKIGLNEHLVYFAWMVNSHEVGDEDGKLGCCAGELKKQFKVFAIWEY